MVWQHEPQRPDDVRCAAQQHLAFLEGVAHEAELAVFEIPKPAVDQLGAGRGSVGGEVILLAQQDVETPPGRVAGDAGAVDAAADDEEIDRARRGAPHTHRNTAIP